MFLRAGYYGRAALSNTVYDLNFMAGATGLALAGFAFARTGTAWDDFGSASASGVPRINGTFGLLIEPAESGSTALQHTDALANAAWQRINSTISAPGVADPAGGTAACTLTDTVTNGNHNTYQQLIKTIGICAMSLFAKPGTLSRLKLRDSGSVAEAIFLLAGAGSVVSSTGIISATIFPIGATGWYRAAILYNNTLATATARGVRMVNDAGSDAYAGGSGTLDLWRLAISALSTTNGLTTAIPLTTAAVTRNAETCIATRSAVTVGSVLLKARAPVTPNADERVLYSLNDGTSNNRVAVVRDTAKALRLVVTSGGTSAADLLLGTAADNTVFKLAVAFTAGDIIAKSSLGTDQTATAAIPAGLVKECLGHGAVGGTWGRTLERVSRVRTRLPDAELQTWLDAA